MKNLDWRHFLLLGIIIALLFIKSCAGENTETKITIKDKPVKIEEVNGEIKLPTNQDEIPVAEPDTIFLGEPIYLPSPLDKTLAQELKIAKDSIERYKLLADAARKREYSSDFEDELVKINVHSTVFGKLDKNEIKYTLKERTVVVQETLVEKTTTKNKTFGLLMGGGLNKNLNTQQTNFELNAGIRINKVNILGSATTDKTVGLKTIIEF